MCFTGFVHFFFLFLKARGEVFSHAHVFFVFSSSSHVFNVYDKLEHAQASMLVDIHILTFSILMFMIKFRLAADNDTTLHAVILTQLLSVPQS